MHTSRSIWPRSYQPATPASTNPLLADPPLVRLQWRTAGVPHGDVLHLTRATMKRTLPILGVLLASVCGLAFLHGDESTPKRTPKEALQAFNDLIGSWRGTGTPQQGTKEERDKNFWQETISWEWQFKDKDSWHKVKFDKSKYFDGGELRYLTDGDKDQITLCPLGNQ